MSAVEKTDKKVLLIKATDAVVPPSGFIRHYKNHWWVYDEESDSIVFWTAGKNFVSSQCNTNESIVRGLQEKLYPWATVKFFASVFTPIDPNDFIQ